MGERTRPRLLMSAARRNSLKSFSQRGTILLRRHFLAFDYCAIRLAPVIPLFAKWHE